MPPRLGTPNAEKIVELSLAGKSYDQIAVEIGISESYVLVIRWKARKAGIPIPADPRRNKKDAEPTKRSLKRRLGSSDEGNAKWKALSDEDLDDALAEEVLRDG
jgi:transposase